MLNGNVSDVSIAFMFISVILSSLLPLGVIIYLVVKKRLKVKALLFGALLFIVFALVLEQLLHLLVLGKNPTQSFLFKNPVLYAIYGGLAAGIFEETARLLGFKFLIKVRENESIDTGISYGFGHGGIEAILLGGLVSVSNIINSVLINSGTMEKLLAAVPDNQSEAAIRGYSLLISTSSLSFLMVGIERVIALLIQISLSLFVLKAVTERKWIFFLAAIIVHAVIDFPAALYQAGTIKNVFIVEIIALVFSILCALAAYKMHSGKNKPAPAEGDNVSGEM